MLVFAVLAVAWPWCCGWCPCLRRANREQLFDERWKWREKRRMRQGTGDGSSLFQRPTIFRETVAVDDPGEAAVEIPRPKESAAVAAAQAAAETLTRSRRIAIAREEDYPGGEAALLNANKHNDFLFEDLVNVVVNTGDTLFAFNRKLADRVIALLGDDERAEITVETIVAVSRLARDNRSAAKREEGGGTGGGSHNGGDGSDSSSGSASDAVAAALSLIERSRNLPLQSLFCGHEQSRTAVMASAALVAASAAASTAAAAARVKVEAAAAEAKAALEKKALTSSAYIAHRQQQAVTAKAAKQVEEENEGGKLRREEEEERQRREEAWTVAETKRVKEAVLAMFGGASSSSSSSSSCVVGASALHEWMAQQRSRHLAWLKVKSLVAETRFFGKGLEKHGEKERAGRLRVDGAAADAGAGASAGAVVCCWYCTPFVQIRAYFAEKCGIGWLDDYLYFLKNFHPLVALVASSPFNPRSRVELFQILCIDVNLCILLTAVSMRFQVHEQPYESSIDRSWTASWSDFVMVTLPQVRSEDIIMINVH